ncbi:MAG TPA: RNB domain-containing ribonuclease [Thermoanaerobaculia bacterium]|nr:RNB domain-containing ribonuclease [Thermoanaerobaculia bacterium]
MTERGLWPDFSRDALAELDALRKPEPVPAPAQQDLRGLAWVSIDNDDSRDLDQLSVAEALSDGAVRIRVAVADVDGLVAEGSALDAHARHNTTSVYTAAQIFPMLPPKLSTDLTSLNEDSDRAAMIVDMVVTEDGELRASDVYRAAVRNHAKLAYAAVGAGLEGETPLPGRAAESEELAAQLRIQDAAAQRLRRLRYEQGALELETIEPRSVFEGDRLVELQVEKKNRARELIEDFMIAANGVTARFLADRGIPSLRRVVRSPERWQGIVKVAAELGERLPPDPDNRALEEFLARRRRADPLRFPDLSLVIIKLMGSGEYVVERPGQAAVGHFGLAVKDYTHSTAPNRRYPDLVTQRLLKAALSGDPPRDSSALESLAQHCTEMEDAAEKVERQVRKSAAALLLEHRIGQRFDAIVTGASEKGTWVRIFDPPVEGKLEQGWEGLEVGERVRVKLMSTDVERGFIDFVRSG